MQELIPTILGALAAFLFVYAMITRKNALEAKAVLADTTIRYEAALQQAKLQEQNNRTQKDQMEKLKQLAQKAEKQTEDVKNRTSDNKLEVIRVKTEYDASTKKLESQKEHLLEQVQVLTQQLSEAVKEKKQYADELNRSHLEFENRASQIAEGMRTQVTELQNQLAQAKRDRNNALTAFDAFKRESGLVKPEELKRWQMKVARLEQLYSSMKGLREMAEERNENWEIALRFFAAHILGKSVKDLPAQGSIGSIVGEALEKIGATLVIDDAQAPYSITPSTSELAAESHS